MAEVVATSVWARFRPRNAREQGSHCVQLVEGGQGQQGRIAFTGPDGAEANFNFDKVSTHAAAAAAAGPAGWEQQTAEEACLQPAGSIHFKSCPCPTQLSTLLYILLACCRSTASPPPRVLCLVTSALWWMQCLGATTGLCLHMGRLAAARRTHSL